MLSGECWHRCLTISNGDLPARVNNLTTDAETLNWLWVVRKNHILGCHSLSNLRIALHIGDQSGTLRELAHNISMLNAVGRHSQQPRVDPAVGWRRPVRDLDPSTAGEPRQLS